jgi:glycerol-3-phosphate dehydrogenase
MRALLLDARASIETAPQVARIMADELRYDQKWEQDQVSSYTRLAKEYLPSGI